MIPGRAPRPLAALALFIVLAVAQTWPLASAPGSLSRNDNADTLASEWTIAWVQHQIVRQPLRLFDANIFYPERKTLAFAEHLFLQSMLGLPARLAGASPVLVFNLLLIAGFALTGWSAYLVVSRVTGDWAPGVLAGMLMSVNAYTMTHLPHLQSLHLEFVAPAMLALDSLFRKQSPRAAAWLALFFVLQSLASNYLMVALGFAIVAAAAARANEWVLRPRMYLLFGGAAVWCTVLLLPVVLPYLEVQRTHGFTRPLEGLIDAGWRDYLTTGARVHFDAWSHQFWGATTPLFPGVIGAALTLVAIGSGCAIRDRVARMWLAAAVLLVILSLGTRVPGYAWLHAHLPPLQGIRTPARFGELVLAAVAVLSGFGFAWLRQRWAGRRWRLAATLAILILGALETSRAPLGYREASHPPEAYDILAQERRAVVAEFPFYDTRAIFHNAHYMLASTRHWRPLLNGYAGYIPQSYTDTLRAVAGFPGDASLRALRDRGVTHVVVHHEPLSPVTGAFGRMPAVPPALQPIASIPAMTIYRLRWEKIPSP